MSKSFPAADLHSGVMQHPFKPLPSLSPCPYSILILLKKNGLGHLRRSFPNPFPLSSHRNLLLSEGPGSS